MQLSRGYIGEALDTKDISPLPQTGQKYRTVLELIYFYPTTHTLHLILAKRLRSYTFMLLLLAEEEVCYNNNNNNHHHHHHKIGIVLNIIVFWITESSRG